MKDRVPKYPGRVKLTPVSGQENTYDMVRADQPTQEGTPLNKENLLSDATASALGLTGDPTVDDALGRLAKKSEYKVGDIKVTARTDLGDEWVLCNGDTLQEGYADISNIIVPTVLSSAPTSTSFGGTGAKKFVELDGIPYVLAFSAASLFLYTLSGTVALSTNISGYSYSSYNAKGAAYGAGYYVIPGSDTYNKQFIGYFAGLAGTVNLKTFSDGLVGDITYQNGYFVMVGETSSSYPCIWYATTPGGTWTQVVISSDHTLFRNNAKVVYYLNGRFVAVWGGRGEVLLAYSSDGRSWSQAVVIPSEISGGSTADYVDAVYVGDRYYIMQTSKVSRKIAVFASESLNSGWKTSKVFLLYAYNGVIADFAGNVVLICLDSGLYSGTVNLLNSDGSWEEKYNANNVGSGNSIAENAYTSSSRMCIGGTSAFKNWYIKVPNITFDGAYAYIKAKEATT